MSKLETIFEPELIKELESYPIQKFKKGEVLIKELEAVKAIPILLNGKIEVTQSNIINVKTHTL